MFANMLNFPSKEAISSYLEKHSRTKGDARLQDKKIINAVAQVFANKKHHPTQISPQVMLAMRCFSGELTLSKEVQAKVRENLTAALNDCATNKPLVEEKKAK
mgnify:CR=1 FL=1